MRSQMASQKVSNLQLFDTISPMSRPFVFGSAPVASLTLNLFPVFYYLHVQHGYPLGLTAALLLVSKTHGLFAVPSLQIATQPSHR